MATATQRRNKAKPDRHPDQLDELIAAKAMPCHVLPRAGGNEAARKADKKERVNELRAVAAELRDAQNAMVAEWLGYHLAAGTGTKLVARESGVEGMPSALFLAMYHAAKPCAATAATDVLTCALNWLVRTIRTQTSPRSNLRRWQAVLVPIKRERPWFWDAPQPIRLSAATTKIEIIGGKIQVVAKVVRGAPPIRLEIKGEVGRSREGGPGKNGQKYNDRLAALREKLAVNGAMLTESRGTWYYTFLDRKVAPKLPVKEKLKTLFVRASAEAGWRIRFRGRSAYMIGGDALADLGDARRRQIARRSEMKVRGVDSRTTEAQAVKHLWSNYCRTLNQQTACEIVTSCERHGIERIAVMPGGEWCALDAIGNDDLDKHEPTRFPMAEFATILKQKAMQAGIIVVSRPNFRSSKRRKERWLRNLRSEG